MKKKYCLLLTASIMQENPSQGNRSSVAEREKDYLSALEFYSAQGIPIVFCDNSGYKSEAIEKFCEKKGSQIELMTFKSEFSHLGKSHGEKEIMDRVHELSEKIRDADYIIKITGRLIVKNISGIINKLDDVSFVISANMGRNLTWTDSRFYVYQKLFYAEFLKISLDSFLDEPRKIYFENCLCRAIHLLLYKSGGFILLPLFPDYSGFNGTTNKKYDKGIITKLIYSAYYRLKVFIYGKLS